MWFYDLSAGSGSWTDNWNVGYDSETGVDYEPTGPYYFAWSGDESNTIMRYIDLNWDFSQFDRDNMNRYLAAAFAAKAAYNLVGKGAGQAGVPVVGGTEGWQVDESASGAAGQDRRRHHGRQPRPAQPPRRD